MALTRRQFLASNAAGSFAFGLEPFSIGSGVSREGRNSIRLGVIGTGNRGRSLLNILLEMDRVEVPALCDIQSENLEKARAAVVNSGRPEPDTYSRDEEAFRNLIEREDLDAVIIATFWEWHAPMAVYAMECGKYAGVEVPVAYTLEECWQLIRTYEKTGVPCMMLENWSFRRDNLAVLKMIRTGLLGEMVHCHCAHSHDCIDHWFFDPETGLDRWAAKYLLNHNRDQYPTHQQGPILGWMNIGCGDYYDSLTSTATGGFGINDYFLRRFGPDHPNAKRAFRQGDIVTTVIRTKLGKSVAINYDMQLPRPYDNRWMAQGTRGIYNEQRQAVYLSDRSPGYHEWEDFEPYQSEFNHSWWKRLDARSEQLSHGGTDHLELELFVEAVRLRTQTPLDVYDSVTMSANGPLSEMSIAEGGKPVEFPDFTRGRWRTTRPRFALEGRV